MGRTLNVQTPGEAPKQPEDTGAELTPGGDTVLDAGDGNGEPGLDPAALQARIAELEAENAQLAAKKAARDPASRAITRADREKFKNMRADEVDPSTLVAAVLTKDGWVAPDQTGQKPKVN